MTTMKKMLCVLLALSLLLAFGCKKEQPAPTPDASDAPQPPVETPQDVVVQPQPPEEPAREINTVPHQLPNTVVPESELSPDGEAAREAAFNSYREVGYFVEWQLGEEYRVMEVLPGDKDGEYLLWGVRIKEPGLREPFRMLVHVTPDGKDFSLLSKQMLDVSEEWKAVQNYRWLVSNWNAGPDALLEALGFEAITVDNLSDIAFDQFQASMLSIMTQEMYDAHWADCFWEQDGMLAFADFSGDDGLYLVETVQAQEDGSWLSHEFLHDRFDTFTTFTVRVDLEELPNGSFRVAAWDVDNAALMAQANTAAPQQ